MAIEDTLARVELFADLRPEDLARVAKLTLVRQYKTGDVIVRENEAGVAFYVIASGKVELVKGLGTSSEQIVGDMGPEDFFGEMALFDNQVRSLSVRAAQDTECLVLTKWDFNAELSASGCRIATAMLAILARRIRTLQDAATH
jgi:CRP/FNR family cyclic AMP-dependent transcriptional regulator